VGAGSAHAQRGNVAAVAGTLVGFRSGAPGPGAQHRPNCQAARMVENLGGAFYVTDSRGSPSGWPDLHERLL